MTLPVGLPTTPDYTSLLGVPLEVIEQLAALGRAARSGDIATPAEWVRRHVELLTDTPRPDEELAALREALFEAARGRDITFNLMLAERIGLLRRPRPMEQLEELERLHAGGSKRWPRHVTDRFEGEIMALRRMLDVDHDIHRSVAIAMDLARTGSAADWIDAQLAEDPEITTAELRRRARAATQELDARLKEYDARRDRLPRLLS